MATHASSSTQSTEEPSTSTSEKPLMVRVKRKRLQAPIGALWLEFAERPTKRLESALETLSLHGAPEMEMQGKTVLEAKTSRLLFHHLETITSFGDEDSQKVDSLLKKFHDGKYKDIQENTAEKMDCQGKDIAKAQEMQQALAKTARFEQLRFSRKGPNKSDTMSELFHLYDIMRVDGDSNNAEKQKEYEKMKREEDIEEERLLHNFLPLFKDHLPAAAAEIESSMHSHEAVVDEYVYDVYALGVDVNMLDADTIEYPVVQVVDDDFSWGVSSESEYDSEDSNAENNPLNDYPEEEGSESEILTDKESGTEVSDSEVEEECARWSDDGTEYVKDSDDDSWSDC